MADATVELRYTSFEGNEKLVDTTQTDSKGFYSFTSLIPGPYDINATKRNAATGYFDYEITQEVTLTENETTTFNVSIDLAAITVTGTTQHSSAAVEDVTITFTPDALSTDNTAVETTATSDASGDYTAAVTPGWYNVTVEKTEGTTIVYTYEGKLQLVMGQGVATYPIDLVKESVSVSGTLTYEGELVSNVSFQFMKDDSIENNTAVTAFTQVDADGFYEAELTPGTYAVEVDTPSEDDVNITYSYSAQLILALTNDPYVYNIEVQRESVTTDAENP